MLCCVVPIEAPGCSAGAYADGVAGPSAAADVPVQETCEDLRARTKVVGHDMTVANLEIL